MKEDWTYGDRTLKAGGLNVGSKVECSNWGGGGEVGRRGETGGLGVEEDDISVYRSLTGFLLQNEGDNVPVSTTSRSGERTAVVSDHFGGL